MCGHRAQRETLPRRQYCQPRRRCSRRSPTVPICAPAGRRAAAPERRCRRRRGRGPRCARSWLDIAAARGRRLPRAQARGYSGRSGACTVPLNAALVSFPCWLHFVKTCEGAAFDSAQHAGSVRPRASGGPGTTSAFARVFNALCTPAWLPACAGTNEECGPPSVKASTPQFADAFVNEDAHLVGHQPGLRVDDLHRHRLGFKLFQHVFELPALAVGRDHVRQEHAQAHAVDAGIDGRIDLIAGDDAVNRNTLLAMANLKMPLVARNETEMSDALVRADVVRDLRDAVAAQVLLTGAYDTAH